MSVPSDPGSAHGASPEDVREHSGALDILHHEGEHRGQLGLAQGVGESAGPVDVVNGRVRVLVVAQVDIFHGEERQLVRAVGVAPVLHVARNLEQL